MESLSFENLIFDIFPTVYPPQEDSFLLAKHLHKVKGRVLDLGCGSGIQGIVNLKHNPENTVVFADLNPEAVRNARHNFHINFSLNGKKEQDAFFLVSDLFSALDDLKPFDAIFFNPPYLPTSMEEKLPEPENFAYDGGKTGRRITDRFLHLFGNYLAPSGEVYLIQSSLSSPEKTKQFLKSSGYSFRELDHCSFFFERVILFHIIKK